MHRPRAAGLPPRLRPLRAQFETKPSATSLAELDTFEAGAPGRWPRHHRPRRADLAAAASTPSTRTGPTAPSRRRPAAPRHQTATADRRATLIETGLAVLREIYAEGVHDDSFRQHDARQRHGLPNRPVRRRCRPAPGAVHGGRPDLPARQPRRPKTCPRRGPARPLPLLPQRRHPQPGLRPRRHPAARARGHPPAQARRPSTSPAARPSSSPATASRPSNTRCSWPTGIPRRARRRRPRRGPAALRPRPARARHGPRLASSTSGWRIRETLRSNGRLGLLALVVIINLALVRAVYSLGGADFFVARRHLGLDPALRRPDRPRPPDRRHPHRRRLRHLHGAADLDLHRRHLRQPARPAGPHLPRLDGRDLRLPRRPQARPRRARRRPRRPHRRRLRPADRHRRPDAVRHARSARWAPASSPAC